MGHTGGNVASRLGLSCPGPISLLDALGARSTLRTGASHSRYETEIGWTLVVEEQLPVNSPFGVLPSWHAQVGAEQDKASRVLAAFHISTYNNI